MKKKYLVLFMFTIAIFSSEVIYAKGQVGITSSSAWGGTNGVDIIFDEPTNSTNIQYNYNIIINNDIVEVTASSFRPAGSWYPEQSLNFHCIMTVDTIGPRSNFNFQHYRDVTKMFGPGKRISFYDINADGGCDKAQLIDMATGQILYPNTKN